MKFTTLRAPRRPSCTTPLAKPPASITKPRANAPRTFMTPRRRRRERLWRRLATQQRARPDQSRPQWKLANKLTSKRSARPNFPAALKPHRLTSLRRQCKEEVLGALSFVHLVSLNLGSAAGQGKQRTKYQVQKTVFFEE